MTTKCSSLPLVMDGIRSKPNLSNDVLIKRIKANLLAHKYRRVKYARKLLGVLLAKQNGCHYTKVAKELKAEIGIKGFKVTLSLLEQFCIWQFCMWEFIIDGI